MVRRNAHILVLSLAGLLLGCADDDADPAAGGAGGTSALPTQFGGDRPVELFVPDNYDEAVAAPLVILLHGYGVAGVVQDLYFQLKLPLAERGILYAHPNGTVDEGGSRFWNASEACCDRFGTGVDDSAYLGALIDDITAAYKVDPKRVYFLGHSNGGYMSYRMACDHADRIAAIAPLAGNTPKAAACNPSEPVHVLHIHGTADDAVSFDSVGGFPGAVESAAFWADVAGCDSAGQDAPALDLDADIAGSETVVTKFDSGCAAGGSAELWAMAGAGHVPAIGAEFTNATIDWLLAHPKP